MEITTVPQLVAALAEKDSQPNPMKVLDIMKSVNIPQKEFERYYTWDQERYTRNVLMRNEKLELLLICMEKGQSSPIHDFYAQEAWIHPIVGRLREERFKINPGDDVRLEQISSVLLGTEEYSYLNQVGIHRYSNAYEARSVSLNVYAKPLMEWRVYDETTTNSTVHKTWANKDYHLLEMYI